MKENEKTIYTSLEVLKKMITEGGSNDTSKVTTLISEIEKQAKMISKERKGLYNLLLILIAFLIFIAAYAFNQQDENHIQAERINSLERIDSIYRTFMQPHDGSISYRVDREGNPVSYKKLMTESDSLQNRIWEIEHKLYDCEFELKFIKDNYPIKVIRNGNTYTIDAAKIDSALMILDVYRDKISYDKEKNYWIIK